MQCPACKSDNVRSFGSIYESETIDSDVSGTATVFNNNYQQQATVASSKQGVTQSRLAQRCSPPEMPSRVAGVIGGIVIAVAGYLFGGWAYIFVVIGLGVSVFSWDISDKMWEYEAQLSKWERMWYCYKCGKDYEVQ